MATVPGNQKKQPIPANNGSKNAPLKGKEIFSLLKNQKMERTMQDLFVTLKKNDAENLEINAFLDSLTYRIEKGESFGLLRLLSAQKTNKQETQINFGEIQSESCSLEELKVLDLTSFPSLSEQDPLKLGVEKAVVAYIKAEFSKGLKGEIGKKFSNFVRYNHTSLSELLNALEYFPDELNNLDQKSAFCAFRDAFRMSFFQLKEQLANGSTAISLDELNTKTFDQWTESQKVIFDTMFTKLFLNREKGRLTQLNQLTQEVGQVFSKPLPLASLCSKYPCSYEGLQERAKINRPDVLEALADCEQRRAAGEESAEAEIEQHYRTLYLETIKEQDSRLAVALTFLYEHDFDFAALEQEKALKADFFRSLAESRLEQMENA